MIFFSCEFANMIHWINGNKWTFLNKAAQMAYRFQTRHSLLENIEWLTMAGPATKKVTGMWENCRGIWLVSQMTIFRHKWQFQINLHTLSQSKNVRKQRVMCFSQGFALKEFIYFYIILLSIQSGYSRRDLLFWNIWTSYSCRYCYYSRFLYQMTKIVSFFIFFHLMSLKLGSFMLFNGSSRWHVKSSYLIGPNEQTVTHTHECKT